MWARGAIASPSLIPHEYDMGFRFSIRYWNIQNIHPLPHEYEAPVPSRVYRSSHNDAVTPRIWLDDLCEYEPYIEPSSCIPASSVSTLFGSSFGLNCILNPSTICLVLGFVTCTLLNVIILPIDCFGLSGHST